MNCLPHALPRFGVWCLALAVFAAAADAQFKEVGPAPFSPAVARQKIRASLETADPGNPQRTVQALLALVPWYRDILDQELITAWQKGSRANLSAVLLPLADAAVATAIVQYSWRQAPETAFNLSSAPVLGELMARYPDSATPFLADLLSPGSSGHPPLTRAEAEAVCRILLDMPDIGNWKKSALQILPRYRPVAVDLLNQDLRGSDREKGYRAQMWLRQLDGDAPGMANQQTRRKLVPAQPAQPAPAQPAPIEPAPTPIPTPTASAGATGQPDPPITPSVHTVNGRPTLARADGNPAPAALSEAPPPPAPPPSLHREARSGTLQCSGVVPQNAEFVFRNLPAGNLQVELDTRIWEARLVPFDGRTQELVLKNISSGPQKHCKVRWSVSP